MADLITTGYAEEYLPNFNTDDLTTLQSIITACSQVVEKYCNRTFALTTYDELYSHRSYISNSLQKLFLKNIPVTKITRFACNPSPVIYCTNTTADRATIRSDGSNLYLESATNGVTTNTTLAFATYTTVGALATAVSAVSGWTGTAISPYNTWGTADITALQGATRASKGCSSSLAIHVDDISDYKIDANQGILWGFWFRGINQYRVVYQAGYSSIPDDLKQATALLVATTYKARKVDSNITSEMIGAYSYTIQAHRTMSNLPAAAVSTLNKYRILTMPEWR